MKKTDHKTTSQSVLRPVYQFNKRYTLFLALRSYQMMAYWNDPINQILCDVIFSHFVSLLSTAKMIHLKDIIFTFLLVWSKILNFKLQNVYMWQKTVTFPSLTCEKSESYHRVKPINTDSNHFWIALNTLLVF